MNDQPTEEIIGLVVVQRQEFYDRLSANWFFQHHPFVRAAADTEEELLNTIDEF